MGFDIPDEVGGGIPVWYRYLMVLLTGSIIFAALGSAVAQMVPMFFMVIALGGLAALLMVLLWCPEWTTYDRPDEKWRRSAEYPPLGSNRGVFEGFEKFRL